MGTITAANGSLTLGVIGLFAVPQPIQGYAVDDAFTIGRTKTGEFKQGIDGFLSAGLVYEPIPMEITLQADSPSLNFFEAWNASEQAQQDKLQCFGVVRYQSVQRSYTMSVGFMETFSWLSDMKRLLQERKFTIMWQAPIIGVQI